MSAVAEFWTRRGSAQGDSRLADAVAAPSRNACDGRLEQIRALVVGCTGIALSRGPTQLFMSDPKPRSPKHGQPVKPPGQGTPPKEPVVAEPEAGLSRPALESAEVITA